MWVHLELFQAFFPWSIRHDFPCFCWQAALQPRGVLFWGGRGVHQIYPLNFLLLLSTINLSNYPHDETISWFHSPDLFPTKKKGSTIDIMPAINPFLNFSPRPCINTICFGGEGSHHHHHHRKSRQKISFGFYIYIFGWGGFVHPPFIFRPVLITHSISNTRTILPPPPPAGPTLPKIF